MIAKPQMGSNHSMGPDNQCNYLLLPVLVKLRQLQEFNFMIRNKVKS